MKKKLFKTSALFFSFVLHPVFIPVYGLFVIFNTNTYINLIPYPIKLNIFIIVFVFTCMLPLLLTFLLRYFKLIQSIHMHTTQERQIPLLFCTILYFINYYYVSQIQLHRVIDQYFLSLTVAITMALLINLKWKVSTHMLAIGGITALLFSFLYFYNINLTTLLLAVIVLSGILGTFRLYLKSHIPAQIYVGFFVGFVSVFGVMSIL